MLFFTRCSLFLIILVNASFQTHTLDTVSAQFSALADKNPAVASPFLNPEGYNELNYDSMLRILNRCQTPFGSWSLNDMLRHPLTQPSDLTLRQELLKILISNSQALHEYQACIQKINRPQLLHYWQTVNILHQEIQELYYNFFGFFPALTSYLNSSKAALSLSGNVNSIVTVLGYLGKQCFGSYIKETVFSSHHKTEPHYINGILEGFYYPFHIHNPFQSYFLKTEIEKFSFFYESHKLSGGDTKRYIETFITHDYLAPMSGLIAILATGAAIGTYDFFTVKDIESHINKIKKTYKTVEELSTEIYHIAQWYIGCTQLYAFSQKYPLFAELAPFQLIKKYVHEKNISPELKKLFELLESAELKNSTPTTISSGTALLIHKQMREVKDQLLPLMKASGACDALLSIVKLYLEQQDSQTPYCLPAFTQDAVCIEFINFWHPGVTNNNPVTNSVYLGNNNPRNMIITGPNGGGKSTVMAGISWGIILAQGWGIVPSQHATMRIFTGLRTFLSPQADLEQGLSTFMAEKRRLDSMISAVEKVTNADAYFFIIDEPCRGTIERVSEQFVIQLCHKLAQSDRCISVLATHLEKPTLVAQDIPEYVNYQMELQETNKGFIRTFKLVPGSADWWFNNEPKRTRFLLEL